jgi:threonine/homoserine/homoserine lactone efflux protein
LLVHTTLAALGLTALVKTSTLVFELVRYAGAAYLVFLGIKSFRHSGVLAAAAVDGSSSPVQAVRQGMFTNLFNPKAMLTFLAFIPQFITTGGSLQIIFLGVSMAVLGITWFSVVGYFSGVVSGWVLNSRSSCLIGYLMGCVLIGLGIRLVV